MRRQLIGVALFCAGPAAAVWAQETASGSIAGVVTDVHGGLMPGTTVTVSAGGVLDSEMLARLPVSRRLPETLYLVPGVSSSTGTGSANPSIAGASGLDNQYVIDGVNITHQGWGALGAYSLTFGSLGSGVTTEFIKETEVKTAGFEAEYGQ